MYMEKAEVNFTGAEFCRESPTFDRGTSSKNKKWGLIPKPELTGTLHKSEKSL